MVKKIWNLFKAALDGKTYDYTQGSLNKAIFLLAIPMILELSLESIFAVVDIFFVGKLGPNAIAAVGFTESIMTLIYSVAIGLSTAASAIIARRVGEKNIDDAKYTATQSLIFSIVISIFISILGVVYSSHLLKFMGASNEVILQGSIFTKIMFGGNLSILLLFLINGIFRGAGNAAIAMKSLWISSIINIILVPTLVYGIGPWNGLGLMGAAIATNIGRSAGVIYQLYYLFSGSSIISLDIRKFYPDFSEIKKLIQLAWPATFQFIIASGSWIILAKLISEEGGTNVSAGYQIAIRNVVFFILPAWGLSNAAATLIGQNMGAGNFERAEKSVLITMKYNIIFMCFVTLIFTFLSRNIISIFSSDPSVIEPGVMALQIIGLGYIFYGIGMVILQSLNGAGDTTTPTLINLFGFWIFQIPLAYYLIKFTSLGYKGAMIAIPVAETLIAIVAYFYFKTGKWKKIKI